jgi:hypothetical protein
VAHDHPTDGPDTVTDTRRRRGGLLVLAGPCPLVQEVGTPQTHGHLGVIAQVDEVIGRLMATAAPAHEIA